MRIALSSSLLAGALVCVAGGCRAPVQPTGPTEIVLHVPDYEAFFDASLSLLRLCDFPPDRVDRTRGLIVSHPTTSGQFFEWWRVDSRGPYQVAESSLHTMRRIVTLNIEPVGGTAPLAAVDAGGTPAPPQAAAPPGAGDLYRVRVQVDKSRYSAPERQVTTTSGALVMYSERVPTVEGQRGPQSRSAQWVPLGRDPLLEDFLLQRLSKVMPEVTIAE
jgi:hypothetical protein